MEIEQRMIAAAQRPVGDGVGGCGIGEAQREQASIERVERRALLPQLEDAGAGERAHTRW